MNDSKANVTCGPFGSRRLPVRSGVSQIIGRPTTCVVMRRFAIAYMTEGVAAFPRAGCSVRRAHQLSDQHGVGPVVAEVVVIDSAGVVVERDDLAFGVEPAAQLEV